MISDYPEWVLKHRGTNREIRFIKGHYYVYQVRNTWDRERKRHRKVTERYLGAITPDGLKEPRHKTLMKRLEQISVKEYGASRLLMEVSEDIREALKGSFPEWKEMFVFACMRVIHVTTIKNLEFHYSESYLSEEMRGVSTYPKHTGEMLRSIGMDRTATRSFLKTFLTKSRYMAIDITHVFSLSDNIISAVLGHNAEEKHLPMVELLLLFNLEEHEPSYFRVLTGSVTSVMSIASTADESGLSNVVFVADSGFYSSGNVGIMEGKRIHYIIPLKRNSKLIPYGIEMNRFFLFENRPVWYSFRNGKRRVYLFKDPSLRAEEEKDFLRRNEGKRGAVRRFRNLEEQMGTLSIVTDLSASGEILYDLLKSRVEIEQAYDTFKNTIDADRSYMSGDDAMSGWMLINFIALMLHYRIYNLLRKKGILRKYSPRDVIEHLQRVSKLKIGDEWKLSEIPRKSRKVMEKLELNFT